MIAHIEEQLSRQVALVAALEAEVDDLEAEVASLRALYEQDTGKPAPPPRTRKEPLPR